MSDLVPQVGWLVAFGAGLVSFLSPCVAPLVPGYLSYVSGVSVQDLAQPRSGQTRRLLFSCLLFVLGFSLVFMLLGASASLLGGLVEEYRRPLNRVAGGVMVLMGLFVMGIVRIPTLYQERRFHLVGGSFGQGGRVGMTAEAPGRIFRGFNTTTPPNYFAGGPAATIRSRARGP